MTNRYSSGRYGFSHYGVLPPAPSPRVQTPRLRLYESNFSAETGALVQSGPDYYPPWAPSSAVPIVSFGAQQPQVGDLMIAAFTYTGTSTITGPTGWARLAMHTQGSLTLEVWWKRSDGADTHLTEGLPGLVPDRWSVDFTWTV